MRASLGLLIRDLRLEPGARPLLSELEQRRRHGEANRRDRGPRLGEEVERWPHGREHEVAKLGDARRDARPIAAREHQSSLDWIHECIGQLFYNCSRRLELDDAQLAGRPYYAAR
jgi:hypothetical protein